MGADDLGGVRRRLARVPGAKLALVEDAGHMLHHDQPDAVARAIEPFLKES
jgi:pimeloyl-ACP methyl ester carboxylesterase